MLGKEKTGLALALAWPDTKCKQTGAWYDIVMRAIRINVYGYYRVGHAAIVLVDGIAGTCHYFDFGRYHAPHGHGRVRSEITDHELKIEATAQFSHDHLRIENLDIILKELQNNSSTHGTGTINGAVTKVDFNACFDFAMDLNRLDAIPYGPFIPHGTNCSRFVNCVLQKGILSWRAKLFLKTPVMLTPTPMWNLYSIEKAWKSDIHRIGPITDDNSVQKIA